MAWFTEFLVSIIVAVLTKVAARLEAEAKEKAAQEKLDFERGVANAENSQKYKEAKTRADKIKSALDLLNGNGKGL